MHIYTDGSCINEVGGWACVSICDDVISGNHGKTPYEPCTSNISELYAIVKALELSEGEVVIHSDSMYCVNIFNKWLEGWKSNDWKKSNRKGVKNRDLIEKIDELRQNRNVTFKHVRAHCGIHFNELADKLARKSVYEHSQ